MFGLKGFKLVKELSNIKPQINWLKFSASKNSQNTRNKFFEEVLADSKFVQEDLKIRAMVEEMLQKEFSSEIKNIKSYDFLVDSVVNRLKKNQLKNSLPIEDIE